MIWYIVIVLLMALVYFLVSVLILAIFDKSVILKRKDSVRKIWENDKE